MKVGNVCKTKMKWLNKTMYLWGAGVWQIEPDQ